MTDVAVEFFEAPAAPSGTPVAPRAGRSALPLLAAAYWAVAAGLAAWAPFSRLYTVSYSGGSDSRQHTDGWGRMRITGTDGGGLVGHSPRYGITLVVIAALLLLTSVAHLLASVPWRGTALAATTARVASIAVPGLLAGALMTLAVDLESIFSTVDAAATEMTHALSPSDGPVSLPHAHLGPCTWLAGAALVAAAVAAVLAAVHGPRQRAAGAPGSFTPLPSEGSHLDMTDLEGIPGSETLD